MVSRFVAVAGGGVVDVRVGATVDMGEHMFSNTNDSPFQRKTLSRWVGWEGGDWRYSLRKSKSGCVIITSPADVKQNILEYFMSASSHEDDLLLRQGEDVVCFTSP